MSQSAGVAVRRAHPVIAAVMGSSGDYAFDKKGNVLMRLCFNHLMILLNQRGSFVMVKKIFETKNV